MGSEDESQSWYWADSDGVQSIVDEFELVSSLSTGTLPPYTLVWRIGWREWLPACRIAELQNAIPRDAAESVVAPTLDSARVEPPPPPVDKYQAYRAREAAKLLSGGGRPTLPTPAPPPGRAVIPRGLVAPPEAPPRPPQPTLLDGTGVSATATLRPPGAVPPPPRNVPQTTFEPPVAPPPPPGLPVVPMAPVIQMADSAPGSAAAPPSTDLPTAPSASPRPIEPDGRLPSWSDDVDAELARSASAPLPPIPAAPFAPSGSAAMPMLGHTPKPARTPVVLIALGLLLVGGVVVVAIAAVAYFRMSSSKAPIPAASASGASSASAGPRVTLAPCKISREAARLAPAAYIGVTPVVVPMPDGKLAIGFAASPKHAEGITIDPSTLSVDRPFSESVGTQISSVVPMIGPDKRTFWVDLESDALRSPRSLGSRPRVTLGWTDSGFARAVEGRAPSTLWSGASEKASDTRVASGVEGGYVVTVRRGGKRDGTVLVGRLDEAGAKRGEPVELDTGTQVGTPAIAADPERTLVAFASRPGDDAYWTLRLAHGRRGELPGRPESFSTPPGGLGADAISPAVAGLTNGRWLLQWTEGTAGKRQVRAQTLGSDLIPIGDPLALSTEDANAGQGVVMVQEGKGVSLFFVSKGKSHELWGASLSCP